MIWPAAFPSASESGCCGLHGVAATLPPLTRAFGAITYTSPAEAESASRWIKRRTHGLTPTRDSAHG